MDAQEQRSPCLFGTSTSVAGDDDPTCLRVARSSSAGASMEAYMQSLLQQQQQQQHQQFKGLMINAMSPQLPPPAAMSLRARETASMSLKHIFEQQMGSNGASSREQEWKSTQGQQMGGFQGMRNQSMPDIRKRNIPDLDLTFRKAQDSDFTNAQTGFGSPISTPTPANQDLLSQTPLPMNSQLMQYNHMPQAVASARLTPSSRQPTAQMTVFYSGSVNVYDDVPADKAHAIMLLAGNSWSTNFRCHDVPAGAASSVCTEMMAKKERGLLPMKAAASQQEAPSLMTKPNVNGGGIARDVPTSAYATPAVLSVASPPPSPAPASLADGPSSAKAAVPARRPHAGIELPHARKASLARFLEKRKDRVQVQQVNADQQGGDGGEKGGGDGGESASCSGKPHDEAIAMATASSKKPCLRSCSPSPPSQSTSDISNRENNNNRVTTKTTSGDDESPSQKEIVNEHCFFH